MRASERIAIEKENGFYGISDLHRAFVKEYIRNGFNKIDAYLHTYPSSSSESASVSSTELLLNNPNVKAFLEYERARWEKQMDISIQELIKHHMSIVKSYKKMMKLLNKTSLTNDEAQQAFRLQKTLKASDYRASLREIGLLKGFYIAKSEHTNTQSFEVAIPALPTSNPAILIGGTSKILEDTIDTDVTGIRSIKSIEFIDTGNTHSNISETTKFSFEQYEDDEGVDN